MSLSLVTSAICFWIIRNHNILKANTKLRAKFNVDSLMQKEDTVLLIHRGYHRIDTIQISRHQKSAFFGLRTKKTSKPHITYPFLTESTGDLCWNQIDQYNHLFQQCQEQIIRIVLKKSHILNLLSNSTNMIHIKWVFRNTEYHNNDQCIEYLAITIIGYHAIYARGLLY